MKLKKFIEDSVRFFNCQFIISTHSPFLLKLMDAKIYDLDEIPVKTKKWTELSNVLVYYNFFKEYENEFNKYFDLSYIICYNISGIVICLGNYNKKYKSLKK